MKKSLFALFIFSLWFSQYCFAQLSQVVSTSSLYSPPSPNASALLRYANVPVDEHTGVASVVLPIDQLSGRQLNVPITLSYHGSGNKVLDISSNVGLGFVLNAGGVITRVMRGLPDESSAGFQYNGKRVNSGNIDSAYLNATMNGKIDGEPDLFYFNFLGHTGKFVIDTLGNAQYLPDQGMRVISHPIHNNPDSTHNAWVLKDFTGTTYIFGSDTTAQELTVVYLAGKPISTAITYTSSWYLSKVITSDGKETMFFKYSSGPNLSYEQFRNITTYNIHHDITDKRKFLGGVSHHEVLSAINTQQIDESTVIQVLSPKYLSTITNDMGSVTFSYLSRQDLAGGQSLSQMKVYNNYDNATPLKTYTFNESYFQSANPKLPTDPDAKRLRLDCVSLQGRNAETKQLFVFTYNNQTILPARYSDLFDNWGYYTSTDDRAGFPPINLTTDSYGNYDDGFDRRVPDSVRLKACMLLRIRNLNGGYTNLNYSMNEYQYNNGKYSGGGLRISSVIESDSLGQVVPTVKRYSYLLDDGTSSGMIFNPKPYYIQGITNYAAGTVVKPIPSLGSVEINNLKSPLTVVSTAAEVALTIIGSITPVGLAIDIGVTLLGPILGDAFQFFFHHTHHYHYDSPTFVYSSTALNNLFDINGASVTYSQVEVINADRGKTVNYYTSQKEHPDSASSFSLNINLQPIKTIYGNTGSYPPNTSFDFERGLLLQSNSYDSNSNLVSSVNNTYQLSRRVGVVSGQRSSVSGYATLANNSFQVITYNVGLYNEISENMQLVQSTTQLYDQNNNGTSINTTHSYTWQPNYPTLMHSESTPRSDGNLLVNYTSYPMEYASGTPWIDNMVSHYMLAAPIEKVSTLVSQGNTAIIGGTVTRYKTGGLGLLDTVFSVRASNPIPLASFKFSNQLMGGMNGSYQTYKSDNSYIAKAFYQLYDSKNNLIQSQNIGEPSSSTVWGYNQDVPIAKVSNATVAQIAYTGFETNDQQYWLFTASGRDSSGAAKTGKIRYQLSSGQLKTKTSLPAGIYIISLWTQGAKPTIGGTSADASVVNGESDNNSWNFYMDRITVSAGSQVTLTGTGLVDEIRLYPLGAHMSTISITPQTGTSSLASADDKVNTFQYDPLLRLKTERDDQNNILKKYDYSNVPQVGCTSLPDTWIGINPVCYTDLTGVIPNVANYSAVGANSYGNIICVFTRVPAEANYLSEVNYTVSFSDNTTYSNSTLIKSGDQSGTTSPPLGGKSAESVTGVGIDTVINLTDDYGTAYQSYQNRQRTRDGFTEANTVTGGIGTYVPPARNSIGCPMQFNNHAQTGFAKNNCSTGTGSIVTYIVAANTYTAVTQFKADSMARAAGQTYANSNGNCTAIDTSFVGINPHCITGTADSGTPTLSSYTAARIYIPLINIFVASITRTSAESVHDATVTYNIKFNDGSTVSYSTPMYKNQLIVTFIPPLSGYSVSSVTSLTVTSVSYSAINRLAYTNRQRYLNGVPDGYIEANSAGTYYLSPIEDPGACGIWFYNTPQTSFYRNNCTAGIPGSQVVYTVPAHSDSSSVSQVYADALSRSRGQAYANTHGTCSTAQTIVTTYAGNGITGYIDGNMQMAEFNNIGAMVIDGSGNLFVADNGGTMIRKITADGKVSTLAGGTTSGYVNATGTAAKFQQINGMAIDPAGNIYVADFRNFVVRKVTPQGVVTTFAGSSSGHVDGQGTAAKFDYMDDITIDLSGNLYVMEGYEDNGMRIRKITPGGLVSTLAGNGTAGNVDGPYSSAEFASYQDITVDRSGNIYKGDFLAGATNGAYIRKVGGGNVSTFAGNMNATGTDLDGTGTAASFSHNLGHLTTDANGNVYLADFQATNVRKITPTAVVTRVAGQTTPGYQNGPSTTALFYRPSGIVVDAAGNLYVADGINNVIRKITFPH